MQSIQRHGIMFVLSSSSGAGKTTICNHLLQLESNLTPSISVTTRPMRKEEINGCDYHFVTKECFKDMLNEGCFLEYAEVFDHYYGTPKKQVLDALATGRDIIFDIDWQGTQQLAQLARTDLVSVFVLPPSIKELEQRLRKRAKDSEEVIQKRTSGAVHELSHWAKYDYVVINYNLEKSVSYIRSILIAERLKRTRQLGLVDFVNHLRHPEHFQQN